MSSPMGIVVGVLVALSVFAFATHEEEAEPAPSAPVEVIAHRVEQIRGVTFERIPNALRVSPEQARAEGLADLERGYPAAAREADETLYEMLGLVPAGTDLKEISASLFGEQVAGYYDPRNGRLRVVEGSSAGNRVLDEITLAHELGHALEDQVFELDTAVAEDTGDAGYAYRALVEGSATAVMFEYAGRHFKAEEALAGLLSSAFSVTSTTPLPPFVQASFTWPYLGGQAFVNELYAKANRTWRLVDVALQSRPPSSTEQVLHPEKWLAVEEPEEVVLRPWPESGWRKLTEGTFGEWQTGQMLGSPRDAEGWGGDRYALWTRGEERALAMRWVWDTPADAAGFEQALLGVDWPDELSRFVVIEGVEVVLGLATSRPVAEAVTGVPPPRR
jgi:hypothetical protein